MADVDDGFNQQLPQERDALTFPLDAGRRAGRSTSEVWDQSIAWPDPVDFLADDRLTGVPVLRREHLPDALAPFIFDAAKRLGVDPTSVALAALVSCASVVSDDWRVQPKQHDDEWTEQPRLWGAIVGDPSVRKSPVIAACTRPVEHLERRAGEEHAREMRRFRVAEHAWKKAGSDPDAAPKSPRRDRFMVEGTTIEALSEVLRDDCEAKQRAPAGKVLCRQDEMSEWIGGMDRYRSGGKGSSDRGAYLRLYNGGRWTVDRIGRGAFTVPNWSACFIGGIQPEPIQRIARDAADDGLLQRFMYVVSAHQPAGEDQAPDRAAIDRYESLVSALVMLRPPPSEPGRQQPRVVLHAGAHRHRIAIDKLATALQHFPDTSNRMKSALGKWGALFARVALVFHLIELADARAQGLEAPPMMVLSEANAARASAFLRDIALPHLQRADAIMFQSAQTGHARWIAEHILAHSKERISARDIDRAYKALREADRREIEAVMEKLELVGWVREDLPTAPGRPINAWTVNPAVHTQFAARAAEEKARREAAKAEIAASIRARH